MKQQSKYLAVVVAMTGSLMIINSSQAQYVLGNGSSAGITMDAGGSFAGSPTTTANGLTLTEPANPGYNFGSWDIPAQVYNPYDNTIIFNYTILSPAPGTTGADYTGGAAWTWYSLQPLIQTTSVNQRYYGYDGYNLSYGFPNGQNIANQDVGYVYDPATQTVTLTASLSAAQEADLLGGGTVSQFTISFDPTSTLPDGYSVQLNYIELVPEPGTLALAGLGIAGLVIARRRKV
ncbi:MAG TPA: PEP-CTERM sorting domain-containing protein [Verrucomicrobiae bacterium]|nr:PEP-CTERM sorting domain-containing protein [Verrucomicrobiae bacterium]